MKTTPPSVRCAFCREFYGTEDDVRQHAGLCRLNPARELVRRIERHCTYPPAGGDLRGAVLKLIDESGLLGYGPKVPGSY